MEQTIILFWFFSTTTNTEPSSQTFVASVTSRNSSCKKWLMQNFHPSKKRRNSTCYFGLFLFLLLPLRQSQQCLSLGLQLSVLNWLQTIFLNHSRSLVSTRFFAAFSNLFGFVFALRLILSHQGGSEHTRDPLRSPPVLPEIFPHLKTATRGAYIESPS